MFRKILFVCLLLALTVSIIPGTAVHAQHAELWVINTTANNYSFDMSAVSDVYDNRGYTRSSASYSTSATNYDFSWNNNLGSISATVYPGADKGIDFISDNETNCINPNTSTWPAFGYGKYQITIEGPSDTASLYLDARDADYFSDSWGGGGYGEGPDDDLYLYITDEEVVLSAGPWSSGSAPYNTVYIDYGGGTSSYSLWGIKDKSSGPDSNFDALCPPSALSASISGPSALAYKEMGYYTANASGGQGNYTYQWYYKCDGWSGYYTLGTQSTQSRLNTCSGHLDMKVVVSSDNGWSGGTQTKDATKQTTTGGINPKMASEAQLRGSEGVGLIETALIGNYPNPFNPTTSIHYSLGEEAHVTLKVYDMLGRDVAILVDSWQDTGAHAVSWNASFLPSGNYLYRLTVGSVTETKLMTLQK